MRIFRGHFSFASLIIGERLQFAEHRWDEVSSGQEILALLNCRRLPARLSTGETAVLLGFQEHHIAPLIAANLPAN